MPIESKRSVGAEEGWKKQEEDDQTEHKAYLTNQLRTIRKKQVPGLLTNSFFVLAPTELSRPTSAAISQIPPTASLLKKTLAQLQAKPDWIAAGKREPKEASLPDYIVKKQSAGLFQKSQALARRARLWQTKGKRRKFFLRCHQQIIQSNLHTSSTQKPPTCIRRGTKTPASSPQESPSSSSVLR
jgi:hypothetical protein